MEAVKSKHITKHFDGVYALDNLSLSFEKGEITSIVGPNGSGKTTFINTLTGVIPHDKGSFLIQEVEKEHIRSYEVKDYGLTRTFQAVRLFEQMSVLDNILLAFTERTIFRALFERHNKLHIEQAEDILKRVDLWDKRNENAENLSYGQRKLLEIARALATRADIYLFDEPFAGLFPQMVDMVISIIKELRMGGKTVILVEHNMDIVRILSDHLIVLDAGKLLAEGEPNTVLKKKEVIEAYLGS